MGDEMDKMSRVVQRSDGWHVVSRKGKNLGGPYKNKNKALERLRQVEYFKHHGKRSSHVDYDMMDRQRAFMNSFTGCRSASYISEGIVKEAVIFPLLGGAALGLGTKAILEASARSVRDIGRTAIALEKAKNLEKAMEKYKKLGLAGGAAAGGYVASRLVGNKRQANPTIIT